MSDIVFPPDISFLILDDMASIRQKLATTLRKLKITGDIFEAENVAGAKEVLEKEKIDFILSDWNLPDGTGLKFLQHVRQIPKYVGTPFIMITTEDDISNILGAVKSGANNYIVKSAIKYETFLEKLNSSWNACHPSK